MTFLFGAIHILRKGEGVSQILRSNTGVSRGGSGEYYVIFFSWYSHLFEEVFVARRRRENFVEKITLLWIPAVNSLKKNILLGILDLKMIT